MIDIFEETRSRLTAQDVAIHYGYQPNRANFIHCPFHAGDRIASLKLYPGKGGWHCFACGQGGSIVDFVAQLYDLDPLGAVRQLDRDFNLHLPLDRQQTPQERQEAEKAVQRRRELADTAKEFEAWRGALLNKLNACFRLAHLTTKSIVTPADFNKLTEGQTLAIQWQPMIGHWADCLLCEDMGVRMDVFRDRKGVEARCNQILRSMQTKSGAA